MIFGLVTCTYLPRNVAHIHIRYSTTLHASVRAKSHWYIHNFYAYHCLVRPFWHALWVISRTRLFNMCGARARRVCCDCARSEAHFLSLPWAVCSRFSASWTRRRRRTPFRIFHFSQDSSMASQRCPGWELETAPVKMSTGNLNAMEAPNSHTCQPLLAVDSFFSAPFHPGLTSLHQN